MSYRIILLLCISVCFFVSCGGDSGDGSPAPTTVLKVTHNGSDKHPFHTGFEVFKEVVERETAGTVEVQVFPRAQLGSEEEASQMVMLGLLSASAAGSGGLATFVPEADLFNLPFIFRDLPHVYRVVDGPVGDRVAKRIEEELNCVVLGYWFSGIRNIWNGKKPIMSPDDLVGMKIRVPNSPILVETLEALGAQSTPMSFGQLYSSLQMGVVDGAETDHIDLDQERFYEVTKHVSLTNHMFMTIALIFSKKQFDALEPDVQQAVLKAGRESTIAQREAMETETQKAYEKLTSGDDPLIFYEVDKAPFKEKVKSVYENNAERIGGMEILEEIARQ